MGRQRQKHDDAEGRDAPMSRKFRDMALPAGGREWEGVRVARQAPPYQGPQRGARGGNGGERGFHRR